MMDSYLASKELKKAQHFYLNINFELLNGCKFKCRGCHVEINSQTPILDVEHEQIGRLLESLQNSFYKPFIAFVGPTDFLVADNFSQTFLDPKVQNIFHHFKRISLQTTYLDARNSEAVAEILKIHFSEMEIEVNIVVDPAKILDEIYLKKIEENKKVFLDFLGRDDVRSFGIMNVYDYDQTKIPDLLRNYDFMHKKVSHLFETTIDYNFSAGRNLDLTNKEFLELSERIKKLFDDSLVSDDQAQYLRFSFGKLTDSLIERQYNYRGGALYYSPLLYERFVSFRDELKVPLKDFTAQEIEMYEQVVQLQQYSNASDKVECETCPFLGSCVDRGILHLMDIYDTKSCLVAKKALSTVNSMIL